MHLLRSGPRASISLIDEPVGDTDHYSPTILPSVTACYLKRFPACKGAAGLQDAAGSKTHGFKHMPNLYRWWVARQKAWCWTN